LEGEIPKKVEQAVKKPTEEEMDDLRRKLDQCLSMANKFNATGKAEYFIGMKEAGKTLLETVKTIGRKYYADVADAT